MIIHWKKMNNLIENILETGRIVDPKKWDAGDVFLKLGEEVGELAEAIQVKRGKINKTLKEDEFGELADVLNCALDLVNQVNLDLTIDEFMEKLYVAMDKKTQKWRGILEEAYSIKTSKRIRKANSSGQKRPEYAEG